MWGTAEEDFCSPTIPVPTPFQPRSNQELPNHGAFYRVSEKGTLTQMADPPRSGCPRHFATSGEFGHRRFVRVPDCRVKKEG